MALHTAVATNVDFSDPATWDLGTVPGPTDDVELGGNTVRIWTGDYTVNTIKNTAGGKLDVRNKGAFRCTEAEGTDPFGDICIDCLRAGRVYGGDFRSTTSSAIRVDASGYAEGNFYAGAAACTCTNGGIMVGNTYGSDTTLNTYGVSLYRGIFVGKGWGGSQGHGMVNNNGFFMGTCESTSQKMGLVSLDFSVNLITEQPISNGGRDAGQIYENAIFWAAAGINTSVLDFRNSGPSILDDTWELIVKLQQYFGGGGGGGPVGFPLSRIVK